MSELSNLKKFVDTATSKSFDVIESNIELQRRLKASKLRLSRFKVGPTESPLAMVVIPSALFTPAQLDQKADYIHTFLIKNVHPALKCITAGLILKGKYHGRLLIGYDSGSLNKAANIVLKDLSDALYD